MATDFNKQCLIFSIYSNNKKMCLKLNIFKVEWSKRIVCDHARYYTNEACKLYSRAYEIFVFMKKINCKSWAHAIYKSCMKMNYYSFVACARCIVEFTLRPAYVPAAEYLVNQRRLLENYNTRARSHSFWLRCTYTF